MNGALKGLGLKHMIHFSKRGLMKLLLVFLLLVTSAFAKVEVKSSQDMSKLIQKYASEYQLQKFSSLKINLKLATHPCEDEPQSGGQNCLQTVCSHLPDYACNEQSEISQVLEACRGTNAACVDEVCSKLPSYACNEMSELSSIARSCRYAGPNCVETICGRLPEYACNEASEVEAVAVMCRHTSSSCIEAVCARLPSYACNEISELQVIASQCRGRD